MTTEDQGKRARVLSGMRPTGRMHIGNYFGALANWVRLQNAVVQAPSGVGAGLAPPALHDRPAYECFYFIADWHSLTSDYADTSGIAQNVIEIATDYLAGGLNPAKSVLFLQSLVPEHAELHLLLSMVTPLGWLERVPTYKEALENVKDKDLHNYGFLGYPVLQCADIVMYSSPNISGLFVPTGEDQVSHVETSREIARRFNGFFGFELDRAIFDPENEQVLRFLYDRAPSQLIAKESWGGRKFVEHFQSVFNQVRFEGVLKQMATGAGHENFLDGLGEAARYFTFHKCLNEPESMLTKTPRVPGLDGRKMSKSYGNTITLSESDADIRAKTKVMVTDPARKRRTDPGNPDVCPVYDWHKLFSSPATLEWAAQGCRTAGIGCIECKAKMADHLIEWITPVRERRVKWENNPKGVLEILDEGSKRARVVAQGTMERVREAVFGWEKKRKEIDGAAGSAKA
ncbi:MAG TPA: tryptophan--tRNA ligase [Candidatus Angelobacter sp.]|nr:tryptophan--tRNA ligase [Candidatus Angelobacter sp.]